MGRRQVRADDLSVSLCGGRDRVASVKALASTFAAQVLAGIPATFRPA
jgi:hypothetical protein